jgi:glycosyltransferase involved in cell wall biosynthesis
MTMLPRALIVCHGHPRLTPGGTETVAHDLCRALGDNGIAEAAFLGCVTALHRGPRGGSALQSIGDGARDHLLRVSRFDPFMLCNAGDDEAIGGFARLLAALRPDIVHFHHLLHIGAESLALVRRILPRARIVLTLHDFHAICARDGLMLKTGGDALCRESSPDACHGCFPDRSPERFALRKLHLTNMLGLVDRFVAPSRFLRDRYVAWGIDGARIAAIPNGVPDASGEADDDDLRPRTRFGFFGTVAPHKGVLLAMEAAVRTEASLDLSLTVFGGSAHQPPAFRDALDRLTRRADGRVFHHGPYDRAEISPLMRSIDWVVVPSLWWENAPLVILEAFRHRRPVIAADIGGMAEMVGHGANGLLFRRGDVRDLERAMVRAATERGLWSRLRAGIPPVATVSEMAAAHGRLYRALLEAEQRMSA